MHQHINEIQGLPVIGESYRVPCVTHKTRGGQVFMNVPVIGTIHEDKYYFNVDWYHIHYDARFITGEYYNYIFDQGNLFDDRRGRTEDFIILTYGLPKEEIVEKYERVLPCVRQMPIFPFEWCSDMSSPLQEKLPPGRRKLNKCNRCPHRGTPLNGMQVNRNGVVVCPAHGLAFNTQTREMVLRNKKTTLDNL